VSDQSDHERRGREQVTEELRVFLIERAADYRTAQRDAQNKQGKQPALVILRWCREYEERIGELRNIYRRFVARRGALPMVLRWRSWTIST
jgi:hypothetical protein